MKDFLNTVYTTSAEPTKPTTAEDIIAACKSLGPTPQPAHEDVIVDGMVHAELRGHTLRCSLRYYSFLKKHAREAEGLAFSGVSVVLTSLLPRQPVGNEAIMGHVVTSGFPPEKTNT